MVRGSETITQGDAKTGLCQQTRALVPVISETQQHSSLSEIRLFKFRILFHKPIKFPWGPQVVMSWYQSLATQMGFSLESNVQKQAAETRRQEDREDSQRGQEKPREAERATRGTKLERAIRPASRSPSTVWLLSLVSCPQAAPKLP